jgi:uncharacterized membrane protein
METKRVVVRFFLFALLGLLMEVFFTATFSGIGGNINLRGSTSPWMMLDYGLLGVVLLPIQRRLQDWKFPLPARAFVYMLGIFFIEYVSGLLFVAAGLRIWDYSDYAYNLHGQITLLYAPFWFALGLGVETLHRKVDAIAVLLLRGFSAEDLLER